MCYCSILHVIMNLLIPLYVEFGEIGKRLKEPVPIGVHVGIGRCNHVLCSCGVGKTRNQFWDLIRDCCLLLFHTHISYMQGYRWSMCPSSFLVVLLCAFTREFEGEFKQQLFLPFFFVSFSHTPSSVAPSSKGQFVTHHLWVKLILS